MAKYKVLVVDDDEDTLSAYERILRNADYKVFTAKDGVSAFREIKNVSPDVIVMDIIMPGMDGLTAITKVKNISEENSIPIIVCTTVGSKDDEIAALNLGAAEFCRKTAGMDDLLQKIRKVLGE